MFYNIVFLVVLIVSALFYKTKGPKKNRRNDAAYMIVTGVILALVMALRSKRVGTDTSNYVNLFNLIYVNRNINLSRLLNSYSAFAKAPLWTLLMKWLTIVANGWEQSYLIFSGLFVISFFWVGIYLSDIKCYKAVILYYLVFFVPSLNATRTYMAVSLFYLGYVLIDKRKKIIGIIAFVAATLIHNIAIIGIGIYLLSYVDFSKKCIRRFFTGIILGGVLFYRRLIRVFVYLFPVYSTTIDRVEDAVTGRNVLTQIIFIICIVQTLAVLKKNKITNVTSIKRIRRNNALLITEVALGVIGMRLWYLQRIMIFFQSIILLQWPIIAKYRTKYLKVLEFVLYTSAFLFMTYRIFRNLGNVLPYEFYWNHL